MTKFRILHSIDGPIDDLTVGQICETSGISRQAFYSHFKSKYDVPYWLFDLANDLYVSKIGRELSWEEGYREAFAFIHDEREHLMHCFAENPLDHEVEPYLEKQRKELVATLTDYKRRTVGDELMFYVDFLIYKGNELVVDWCRSGVPPEPGAVLRTLHELRAPQAVRNPQATHRLPRTEPLGRQTAPRPHASAPIEGEEPSRALAALAGTRGRPAAQAATRTSPLLHVPTP